MNNQIKNPAVLFISLLVLFVMTAASGCVEKMALPDTIEKPTFSAGDTKYLQLNPVWDDRQDLMVPVEISIASDGHIFIADSGTNSIIVLTRDGQVLNGQFNSIRDLRTPEGSKLAPIDVEVDDKMNVYYIDGSQRVYVWNQYLNSVGIRSVVTSGLFTNNRNGDTVTIDAGTDDWHSLMVNADWELSRQFWSDDSEIINHLLNPRVIFDGSDERNTSIDIFYTGETSEFSAISAYEGKLNSILVTDYAYDRIIEISLKRAWFVATEKGDSIWAFDGLFRKTVSGYGTGSVTVNQPLGLDIDYSGTIYYSQEGKYFGIHAIRNGSSIYHGEVDDIMELGRFSAPDDICVGQNQYIYVSNTGHSEVQVFDPTGKFFQKAGIEKIFVDTTMVIDSVPVDTFYVRELKGYIERPAGIAVDDRGVIYVCDPPTGRIMRYQLSNELDENLYQED